MQIRSYLVQWLSNETHALFRKSQGVRRLTQPPVNFIIPRSFAPRATCGGKEKRTGKWIRPYRDFRLALQSKVEGGPCAVFGGS
jgi:hypothetical protein